MARKPIQLERIGLRTPRERMWQAMRTLVNFTPSLVEDKAHPIKLSAVTDYLEGLVKAGYVGCVAPTDRRDNGHFRPTHYQVLKFAAVTPQIDKEGEPVKVNLGVMAMWRSMKVRKVFDAELVATDATQGSVICTLWTAKSYLTQLNKAGYLKVEKAAHNGGGLARYRLVRDTGPLPPAVTRAKVVYDRNTGELHTVATPQEVCDVVS